MKNRKLFHALFGSPLRNRFVLFFIVFALVPTLALGATAVYFIGLSHRLDVAALETQLIDQKIAEIQTFLADTQGAMDIQVAFDQKSEIAPDQQIFLLEGLLSENRAFREVRLSNLAGIITAKRDRDDTAPQMAQTSLPEQTTGGIEDISLLPEFTAPSSGASYIGPVQQTLDGPMITLAMPVHNRNGDIIQVLAADVSLAGIFSSIARAQLGQNGYLLVFDKTGALISSPFPTPALGSDFSRRERVMQVLKGGSLSGTDSKDLYESYTDGTPVLGAAKAVPVLGWVILAEWPVVDANSVIDDLRTEVLQLTLLSILAVLLCAPFLVSRLTNPIHQLGAAARSIEEGRLDTSINIKTGDELEELGEQFNTMAKGLKRLQELRNEFVHIVTHELRAPITAIKYAAAGLKEVSGGVLSPEASKLVDPIWVSSEHLVNLVNDLLDVATSEAGKLKFAIEQIALPSIVGEVIEELRQFASQHQVELKYEPADLPPVSADKLRVKQVLMNFTSNAVKYNRPGGTVTIRHEITETEVVTHVADNGQGMSPEDQSHLFEKFYRSAANGQKIEGTGLGLFITKDLVEKMGGRVWTVSKLGEGTTFSFSLPRAEIFLAGTPALENPSGVAYSQAPTGASASVAGSKTSV
ncbi:sensor histidine kinase [Candidatus Kaiserbacteria bacterium]|nr:sensor histidine kinase [Candidatus Kaiserbacteria bacterium]